VRRIAADARKVNLKDIDGQRLTEPLLRAMGFDLGAIHAAGRNAPQDICRGFMTRPSDWLHEAAKAAEDAVRRDYSAWTG